jgi:hypothetical protein
MHRSFLVQLAFLHSMATKRKVSPIPKRLHTVTPKIFVRNASEAIEFYKKAFGAKEKYRMYRPDGKTIAHTEIKIGDSMIMLADEMPQARMLSPQSVGGTPFQLYMYVKDVDKDFNQAVKSRRHGDLAADGRVLWRSHRTGNGSLRPPMDVSLYAPDIFPPFSMYRGLENW